MSQELNTEQLLIAYASGYFPMADSRDAQELYWYAPDERGILPLDRFHIPRSLKKFMRSHPYEITFDRAFPNVIRACAESKSEKRKETWINDQIISLYCQLAQRGNAHSAECWHEGELVGGLYGVSLGGAFFGESMFSRKDNASKVALVHLVERLRERNYLLLDTQYINDHLLQFGAVTVTKTHYMKLLDDALKIATHFA